MVRKTLLAEPAHSLLAHLAPVHAWLEDRGHGFGVFSYLRGYRYRIRSSYRFKVSVGTGTTVRVIPFERGSAFTPLKQRLSVKYEKKVLTLRLKRDKKGRAKAAGSK